MSSDKLDMLNDEFSCEIEKKANKVTAEAARTKTEAKKK